jgi:hypothetical protein
MKELVYSGLQAFEPIVQWSLLFAIEGVNQRRLSGKALCQCPGKNVSRAFADSFVQRTIGTESSHWRPGVRS